MKFLFYHSQLRIREHLTHKQVLLNFSNYVFFCLYSNRSGNIFPYEFNFPKEIPGYTYAYNSRRGDYLSLDSPTSTLKKHHSHAVIFAGSHWTIILFKSHNSSLLKLYGRKRPLAFAWTGMHVFLRLYGVQFTFLHNNEKERNAQMQIALLKTKSK